MWEVGGWWSWYLVVRAAFSLYISPRFCTSFVFFVFLTPLSDTDNWAGFGQTFLGGVKICSNSTFFSGLFMHLENVGLQQHKSRFILSCQWPDARPGRTPHTSEGLSDSWLLYFLFKEWNISFPWDPSGFSHETSSVYNQSSNIIPKPELQPCECSLMNPNFNANFSPHLSHI